MYTDTLQTKDGVQSLHDDMHTISTSRLGRKWHPLQPSIQDAYLSGSGQKKLEALLANLDKPVLQMTSLVQDLHYSLEGTILSATARE